MASRGAGRSGARYARPASRGSRNQPPKQPERTRDLMRALQDSLGVFDDKDEQLDIETRLSRQRAARIRTEVDR